MWHWFLDLFLLACLILFMVDKLTLLWVKRCYDMFYHLMVCTQGYLIFIDIDDFRNFNNRYGHRVGNKILRKIGCIILTESCCRGFRYGGDELVILLPWSAKDKAIKLAERIRSKVEKADIDNLKVTVTCAIAQYEEIADKLLLQAKSNSHKNRVVSD